MNTYDKDRKKAKVGALWSTEGFCDITVDDIKSLISEVKYLRSRDNLLRIYEKSQTDNRYVLEEKNGYIQAICKAHLFKDDLPEWFEEYHAKKCVKVVKGELVKDEEKYNKIIGTIL